MERSGFFDADLVNEETGEYDREYVAEFFASYFAAFIGNGIYGDKSEELMVKEAVDTAMQVRALSGQGFIKGYWYENTTDFVMPIAIADGVLNRKDIIVLQLGTSERSICLKVKQGDFAVNPVAPTVRRDDDYFELELAEIYIPAGTVKIVDALITDKRTDEDVCGFVMGVIQQFDTTFIYNQVQADLRDFKNGEETDFDAWARAFKQGMLNWETAQKASFITWFNEMKDQLSEDAAGHLQNQITDIRDDLIGIPSTLNFNPDGSMTKLYDDGTVVTTTILENGNIETTTITSLWIYTVTTIFLETGSIRTNYEKEARL